MTYKLTTTAACRVANIDRQRFNEYVAGGDYSCAPETVPGRARLFTESDLIALFIFAREVEHQQTRPLFAGMIASKILAGLEEDPGRETATIVNPVGTPLLHRVGDMPPLPSTSVSGLRWGKAFTFNIRAIREIVRSRVEEERQIIGPDD